MKTRTIWFPKRLFSSNVHTGGPRSRIENIGINLKEKFQFKLTAQVIVYCRSSSHSLKNAPAIYERFWMFVNKLIFGLCLSGYNPASITNMNKAHLKAPIFYFLFLFLHASMFSNMAQLDQHGAS